ncbi:hypothetical protein CDU00_20850 [Cronobacter sakazakii]|uniref:hypothetical protein n=1 Tax=Cronobacter sakazakii TaxID=28141 RepID=UPI000BE7D712|nr:hypothetical protein [Cronobacter sakazakii]MDQ9189867.1 hypothetical protein [Cronobacter sakazakii]PUV27647.1 hypothetical protein CDU00_20850 [Cronobacter sakazakii]
MDKSREQFDQWLKQQGLKPVAWIKDEYWKVWKASRAAVEIELPPTTEVHPLGPSAAKVFCELHKNTVAECAKAIRAAGLKVKGD